MKLCNILETKCKVRLRNLSTFSFCFKKWKKNDKGVHLVMYTEYAYIKIMLFKMSCNAQWPVVGLR